MSRQSQSLYDRHITVFSPEGKLFQVEYAFRAVKSCNMTALAMRGPTCACVAVQKKVPLQQGQADSLLDLSSVTALHKISRYIGAAALGIPADSQAIVWRARDAAGEFEYTKGFPIPPETLAQKVADVNQVYTQHAYMRLQACELLLFGIDEDTKKPAIFRVDPAGWMAGYHACAIGTKEQEGANALEKVLKNKTLDTTEKVVEETIATLQQVLSLDAKSTDIEVALITTEDPQFRYLTEAEIDTYLNQISERD